MSDAIDARPFPRGVLIAAAALISFTVVSAAAARLTGIGAARVAAGTAIESRMLRFEPIEGGGYRVITAETGAILASLPATKHGFVGVVLNGFKRDRIRAGASLTAPFLLIRTSGGRSELMDPETEQAILLDAFGSDNLYAFNQFLETERRSP